MKIYFIGIKGSGMSALATILKNRGNFVCGSDVDKVFFTDEKLQSVGIEVQSFTARIPNDTDLVILGNAFNEDHSQVVAAKNQGIEVIRYYQFLNNFAKEHNNSIAVAGTNGKTTTTSMLVSMLSEQSPNYLIGDGNGFGNKQSDTFIFEACEYKNTFYNYYPKYAIINNVEMDHPDFFKDQADVINSFENFADNCQIVILNYDDLPSRKIKTTSEVYYFSKNNPNAHMYMDEIIKDVNGFNFKLYFKQQLLGQFALPFYGQHMIENSLSSLLLGTLLGIDINTLITNLSTFTGAKRRFEKYNLDEENDIILIDDYAHHPTAIKLTLEAMRQQYPTYYITTLFQPHTYSRTIEFLDGFAQTLSESDKLYLLPIFGSIREQVGDVSIDDLKQKVKEIRADVLIEDVNEIDKTRKKQIICVLGAGDIDKIYIPKFKEMFKGKIDGTDDDS